MNNLFPCTKFAEKFKVKDNVLLYHWKPEGLIQTAKIVGKRKEIVDRDSQITIFLNFFLIFGFVTISYKIYQQTRNRVLHNYYW